MGVFIVRNYEIIDRVIAVPHYICIEGYTAFVRDALLSLYHSESCIAAVSVSRLNTNNDHRIRIR